METHQPPVGTQYRDWPSVFDDARELRWTAFNTGSVRGALENNAQPESFPPDRDPAERYDYAVMVFHVEHPTEGDILIDTGFDRTYHDHPPYGNLSLTMRLYSKLKRVEYTQRADGIDLRSHLDEHRITPAHVFLTHLHADHTGGLPPLPSQVPVYFGKQERTLLSRLLAGNHLRGKSSVRLIDMTAGSSLAPFSHVVDVFGDATLWAISTPGHTRDHLAFLVNTTPQPVLIVGDAELTTWAMDEGVLVSTVDGARGRAQVQRSAAMIRQFHEMYPQVQIWFSHDEAHRST